MKAIVQRVARAQVTVGDEIVGEIGVGYLVLLGVRQGDTSEDAVYLAGRTANLRVFSDAEGRFNLSLEDVAGSALIVSQFTLIADTRKGNRPSFNQAALPEEAEALYERYADAMRAALGAERVATGRFGAKMAVESINDGPVTIVLRSRSEPRG